jgi:chromosome segregation protein
MTDELDPTTVDASGNGHDVARDGRQTADGSPWPAAPRLLALRLQGFKSFAERTNVEFGGGISAVVGPNGSGKSNLADALRWALGEQGRALRSRKAEDVIWAGSEKRAAQGMADITLVLDNGDGLLPVDFQVLELGRRLYRSGENEYLLNKQRIRLRDLVDLLDGAHLADNAFLFIGQGMVDQALALRPEERRPLFEEVAGVRRHERRRRKAEEQLVESEANLARVDDILAELRPQARRLAAQAEQQATRSSVGDELAAALLATTHARWHEAASRLTAATERRARAQAEADHAMTELDAAEAAAAGLAAELAARAAVERERREIHEAARAALTALQLRDGRIASDLEALGRDRRRLAEERSTAEAEAAQQRRSMATPVPARDLDLEAAVTEADRELAEALAELATLRSASRARGEELAALRRAEAARQAEAETARRRLAEAERRAIEEAEAARVVDERRIGAAERLDAARRALEFADAAEATAQTARESARAALETAEADRAAATDRAATASAGVAALRGRLDALTERLADEERRPIARAARKVGGRRLDEDLAVDPELRAAVEAALAERARAYLVPADAIDGLAGERGRLLIEERLGAGEGGPAVGEGGRGAGGAEAAIRRLLDAVDAAGGGRLMDALRRDATGGARRLLARAVWAPDLGACLALQALLPAGWIAVTHDGSAVVDEVGVALGAGDSVLERRAEHARLTTDLERAVTELAALEASATATAAAAQAARLAMDAARADEADRTAEKRRAEEAERATARENEAIAREMAWHEAQRARLDGELARLREAVDATPDGSSTAGESAASTDDERSAVATWEARAAELRERRDRLAARLATHDAARRDAEHRRARAEAAAGMAEERVGRADRDAAALVGREAALTTERDALRAEVAAATTAEAHAREALLLLHAADAADRSRLSEAERGASGARERLRSADDRLRTADHAELEARLGLESLREGVLVELAGLGEFGLASLGVIPSEPMGDDAMAVEPAGTTTGATADLPTTDDIDDAATASDDVVADDTAALEAALAAYAERWVADPPAAPPPAPGRLAQLRRRYHELGAANPYAVDEYAELKVRLETLETQGSDLRTAIVRTRELIAELDTMIADQFRTTFAALETAFERRFEQLFGGGYARLSLTDPHDLGSTGVEIVARPPGKKPQALAMLSGGERALTAVALLFAMLEVRPVPFCVLDEVDAALDEANIGRFADALRSLAHQTQFIVITHNRGTIEAADALYGVTVGDDSVSRVISLRLDEAQALAADRGRDVVVAG